jgi:hypothetical protein
VWAVTFLLFFLWMRSGRRREAAEPSGSPGQLALRSAVPAFGVSLGLLVLAVASNASNVFGLLNSVFGGLGGSSGSGSGSGGTDPFGNGGTDPFGTFGGGGSGDSGTAYELGAAAPGGGLHSSIGVSPGWVFFGPLLIAFAAFLVGRFTAVARRAAGDPGGEWIRRLLAPWRAAARVAWIQLRAVAVLAGVAALAYAEYQALTADGSSARQKAALAILAVLLLPNLMVGGALIGFCVSLAESTTLGALGWPGAKIGLFGNSRPWMIYVLLATAVVGTLLPWFLVRTRRRVVQSAAFSPGQVWRSALLGALAGLFAAVLGQVSESGTSGFEAMGISIKAGLTYSVIGAVVAGAVWCAAGYLAVSLLVTPRAPRNPAVAAPAGSLSPAPHTWPAEPPVPSQSAAPEGAARQPAGRPAGMLASVPHQAAAPEQAQPSAAERPAEPAESAESGQSGESSADPA